MLNYTIGAVRKRKSTAKKKKPTSTCGKAAGVLGSNSYKKMGPKRRKSAAILATCKASSEGFKVSSTLLNKLGVKRSQLTRKKK